ncbi:MAG: AraC family transcriptional regulator [Bacteroidota bacterium]|nr:AraC family transcriptional regulator [Bacteroidota bacterium]
MSKIMHEQVDLPGGSPVKMKWNRYPHFIYPWHFHGEYEIVYTLKSYGTRYVGDSIETFEAGDLVFLGSNLPHSWKSDEAFHQNNPDYTVEVIVIQFSENFLSQAISDYPEMAHIRELFKRSERGIKFLEPDSNAIGKKIVKLWNAPPFKRLVDFMLVLDAMAQSSHYQLLASEIFRKNTIETGDRLEKILRYLNYSYQQKLSLKELSGKFNMNPAAFCRYFKEKTSKSLTEYINDLRIGYACKLLQERNIPISQVSQKCGFNNLSHFNRAFKNKIGSTPSAYHKNLQAKR